MIHDCSCRSPGGIRFIEVNGRKTGIAGLFSVFDRWRRENIQPDALSGCDILTAFRKYNYISENVKTEYIEGIRREYTDFIKKSVVEENPF